MTTPLALSPNSTISKASGAYFSVEKGGLTQRGNGKTESTEESPATAPVQKKVPAVDHRFVNKYKHVFAIHAQPRTSCLSHDAQQTPSFIGFRNLMVLVLGK